MSAQCVHCGTARPGTSCSRCRQRVHRKCLGAHVDQVHAIQAAVVTVHYMAPVLVSVDVAAGTVVRVQVVDEEARPDGGVSSPEGVPNTATVQRAREIAAQAEWPAWEFGL